MSEVRLVPGRKEINSKLITPNHFCDILPGNDVNPFAYLSGDPYNL